MNAIPQTQPSELPPRFQAQLSPDEHILWHGIPQQGFRLSRAQGIFLLPAALFECLLLIGINAIIASGEIRYPLLLLLLLNFGIGYVVFIDPIVVALKTKVTHYVLTNRRVLIADGLVFRRIKSIEVASLPVVEFQPESNGRGSILLGHTISIQIWRRLYPPSILPPPTLDRITEAKHVYALIQRIRRDSKHTQNQAVP